MGKELKGTILLCLLSFTLFPLSFLNLYITYDLIQHTRPQGHADYYVIDERGTHFCLSPSLWYGKYATNEMYVPLRTLPASSFPSPYIIAL